MPAVEDRRDNPAELLGMLVGLELADVVTRPDAEPGAEAIRFNRATARRFVRSENVGRIIGVASQRVGAGIGATLLDLIMLERPRDGHPEMDDLLRQIAPLPEHVERMREALDHNLPVRMPILRAAGVFCWFAADAIAFR